MAQFKIDLPDGRSLQVNADTPQDAADGADQWAQANPKSGGADPVTGQQADPAALKQLAFGKPSNSLVDNITGALANVNRGLGVGDELAAGIKTVGDIATGNGVPGNALSTVGDTFNRDMAQQRNIEDSFSAAHPNVAAVSRGVGNAATLAVPTGAALGSGGLALNALRGATTAGLTAAAYGAVDRGSPAERLAAASKAATSPVILGLGAAGGALTTPFARTTTPGPTIDPANLEAAKTAAYGAADNAGVTYTPQAFSGLVSDIDREATAANISDIRHPKASSMLQDLQDMQASGAAPTLTQLDQLRQVVRRDVASSNDAAERFFGQQMIGQIDNFVNSAGPADVTSGSASDAANLIGTARDLNTRYRKVQAINNAVDSAELRAGSTGSGGNTDNAIRQNMRRVLETTPNLSDEERGALQSIVLGGRGQNLLRLVGKLSPTGNGLMAALDIGSAAAAGPLGAVPGIAGLVSKLAADRITRQKVADLVDLMASGGTTPAAITTSAIPLVSGPAAATLSRGAGVAGAAALAPAPNALAISP